MPRTHAQQLANATLPRAVFRDPLAFTSAIAGDAAAPALAALWEQAGAELAPIARMPIAGLTATFERRGLYVTVIVTPPSPRESGDPAAIAIIGRGDGVSKLTTLAYYVLELVLDPATGAPSFTIASYSARGDRDAVWREAPLPDPRWLAEHVFELYCGRTPKPRAGIAELPLWYWWYAFDGASALRAFDEATGDEQRFEVVRKLPVLLLPEIVEASELYCDEKLVRRLRELRPYLLRATSLAPTYRTMVERLANARGIVAATQAMLAIPFLAEPVQQGALTRAQGYELEAMVRAKLATLGIETEANYALADQYMVAARAADQPRVARGSTPPPVNTEDPVWKPLFLDEAELPNHARGARDEAPAQDPTFVAHGGLRAGHAVWVSDAASPLARVVDSRWVFRTASGAAYFMRAVSLSEGLPPIATPAFGDETLAYGDEMARAQVIVIRVGRVLVRLHAVEGAHAAASRHVLHAAMLHPLASSAARRARTGLAAYWLAVAQPTNAVPALVHSPGFDAARLLVQYPLLAHAELPAAMTTLGDTYVPAASALASFQAQLRAHRWATYREAMLALVRSLLASDMGDARVNAAHAYEIVTELRYLDPDPIWMQLDAECRARG